MSVLFERVLAGTRSLERDLDVEQSLSLLEAAQAVADAARRDGFDLRDPDVRRAVIYGLMLAGAWHDRPTDDMAFEVLVVNAAGGGVGDPP